MRLQHKTQRGGTIEHTGPPAPPGETAVVQVDEEGFFEAPPDLGRCLLRVLSPDVIEAPARPRARKEGDS